jgi:hypothetical protein
MVIRRFLLFAIPVAFLVSSVSAEAQDKWTWDGTWTGMQRHAPGEPWPVSITIANGKVASYIVKGAPFDIQYSSVDPTGVTFGDRDNYVMKITKTSDATAAAKIHGRHGSARAVLTR